MSIYPNVTEQDFNNSTKLAEKQKTESQIKWKLEFQNKIVIKIGRLLNLQPKYYLKQQVFEKQFCSGSQNETST